MSSEKRNWNQSELLLALSAKNAPNSHFRFWVLHYAFSALNTVLSPQDRLAGGSGLLICDDFENWSEIALQISRAFRHELSANLRRDTKSAEQLHLYGKLATIARITATIAFALQNECNDNRASNCGLTALFGANIANRPSKTAQFVQIPQLSLTSCHKYHAFQLSAFA